MKKNEYRAMLLCRIQGHKWTYQDYNYMMSVKSEKYDYVKSRRCERCIIHKVIAYKKVWEHLKDVYFNFYLLIRWIKHQAIKYYFAPTAPNSAFSVR